MLSIGLKILFPKTCVGLKVAASRSFHVSTSDRGFESFFDPAGSAETFTSGRAWTVPDLRRKSFEDLHKLWFVLYKERNLLLTTKQKLKRTQRPVIATDEFRYVKVKKSMGAIKYVLDERRKIDKIVGVNSSIPVDYNKTDVAESIISK